MQGHHQARRRLRRLLISRTTLIILHQITKGRVGDVCRSRTLVIYYPLSSSATTRHLYTAPEPWLARCSPIDFLTVFYYSLHSSDKTVGREVCEDTELVGAWPTGLHARQGLRAKPVIREQELNADTSQPCIRKSMMFDLHIQ